MDLRDPPSLLHAALLGEFTRRPTDRESDPVAQLAWRARAGLVLPDVREVTLDELREYMSHPDDANLAHAIGACSLGAVARGDQPTLLRLHRMAVTISTKTTLARLTAEVLDLWRRWMGGEHPTAVSEQAQEAQRTAASERLAHLVIEAATLAALSACDGGDAQLALSLARRASRMARAEELPQQEYLAHLALARVRRHVGHPSLAARILAGLRASAAPLWGGWIAWETLTTAGTPYLGAGPSAASNRFATTAARLSAAASSALRGDREEMRLQLALADDAAEGVACLASDLGPARALLDVEASLEHAPQDLRDWLTGVGDGIPSRGYGICTFGDPSETSVGTPPVWTRVGGGRRAARAGAHATKDRMLQPGIHETSREEQLLAVLATGEHLSLHEAFRAVYGFDFVPEIHTRTFRVLIHRAAKRLPQDASLSNLDDGLLLRSEDRLWVVDPRCSVDTDAFVLGKLAQLRRASARDLAEASGLSVRTIQKALRRLQEDGACSVEKEGRNVNYWVEDTTFEEASRHHRGIRDGARTADEGVHKE
ncbi:MAG: winged helix-turn-helix transcriptional regulator [Myxococcota bacterium]